MSKQKIKDMIIAENNAISKHKDGITLTYSDGKTEVIKPHIYTDKEIDMYANLIDMFTPKDQKND